MKTVLHSISYAGLWRGQARLSLEDFINHAADLGFDGVELTCKRPHAGLLEMTGEARKSVRKVLKDRNLACASLAAYTDFCAGLNGSFIPINEMQLIYIKELVHLAREWECDLIRIFTGYENKPVPYFTQWDACVSAVRECCLLAAPWGIRIGIQNHHDIALDADSLHSFIDEVGCDNCAAMFDPWSPAVRGLDPAAELKKIYDKMVYTTLADYKPVNRSHYLPNLVNYEKDIPLMRACPMGDGIIDNRAFLNTLKTLGYNGFVAYEMCSDLEGGGSMKNLDYCAGCFLDFMNKM